MNLVWTRPAHQDRKSIRDYIATDNPIAAMDLDTLLSQKATNLIEHPGMSRPGRVPGTRELVVHRN